MLLNKAGRAGKCLLAIMLMGLLASCELPPREKQPVAGSAAVVTNSPAGEEEYVLISAAVNLPLYVRHEQAAFIRWARQTGVRYAVLGDEGWNVQKTVEIIEQVINQHPSGMLINGTDPGLATVINKVVSAGIPVVVYDSEVPGSHPNCFIGSDWYSMGYRQGQQVARLTGGKGKVACIGLLGQKNEEDGFRGLLDALKNYPGIRFIGKYNDGANLENAARVSSDLIAANPDLAAICGFTSATGPGIALGVQEAGKKGKIKITCVDYEPEHLKLIREGLIQYSVGQKRELFGSYGAQMLYDMVHHKNRFSTNDAAAGINPGPVHINTGLIEIDSSNIKYFPY
jgi:ABC-type sugar transport system substrate-binding protein